jgi:hypothetical protein
MDRETRTLVRQRAQNRCEYCLLRQEDSVIAHHVEHIVAKQHGGTDEPGNLALACHRCNYRKGPNLTGIDPATGAIVALFHPRQDLWTEHFHMQGFRIEGLTPVARATVRVLAMNDARRLELRAILLENDASR